ncbi:unnamed protein product [Allacma fusca]|uniref:Uncharacterized protein n=1 Tax=Allacma fusca TaxID=39272 RepID=A0A8J2L001_9HEXA|nr:unnamed protein product [Allacma fusca]
MLKEYIIAYQALQAQLYKFDRGVFAEEVAAVIMNRSIRVDLYKCEMFSSLPPPAQNHLRFGNYINGEYLISPVDGIQKPYKAFATNTPESSAKEAAKSACTKIVLTFVLDAISDHDKAEQIDELSPNTTIQSFPNLNPMTIVEISCNYGGSNWMDISFLNSCMQLLVNLSDEAPVCKIINIDALIYSKLDSVNYKWSRIQERLNIVNDRTRRRNYTNRVSKSMQIFAKMLQSRFKDILQQKYAFAVPNIEIEMYAETPVQQDDTKNCGAASLRTLEDIMNDGSDSSIWQLDLKDDRFYIVLDTEEKQELKKAPHINFGIAKAKGQHQ